MGIVAKCLLLSELVLIKFLALDFIQRRFFEVDFIEEAVPPLGEVAAR